MGSCHRRRRTDRPRRFLISAVGCLSSANCPVIPGPETFAASSCTPALAARWRRLHWQAGRRDRHGIVRHPGDSGDRRDRPAISPSSSARRRTPARPRNRPIPADELAEIKARLPRTPRGKSADERRAMLHGWRAAPDRPWLSRTEERDAEYERRWEIGGLALLHGFADMLRQTWSQPDGGRIRPHQDRRNRRRSGGRGRALADSHHRLQATVPRHRLLRHVQPRRT